MIEEDSTLLDIGYGTGDLVLKSVSKIRSGYGVNIDREMIAFAESQRKESNLNHLSFECVDARQIPPRQFDVSTSMLCLRELPEQKACNLLKLMVNRSKIVLIADYEKPKTVLGKLRMEFDEFISWH